MKRCAFILTLIFTLIVGANVSNAQIVDNKDIGAYLNAVTNLSWGDAKLSEKQFSLLCAKNPEDDAAWYYLGVTQLRQKKYREALPAFEKAVALDSLNYWYRYYYAACCNYCGDHDKAESEYEKILNDFPKKTDALYQLVNLQLGAGKAEKALKTLADIETQMGKTDATVITRYDILNHLGRSEEALQAVKSYVDEYTSPEALCLLAGQELAMDRDSAAIAYYNEAIEADRSFPAARYGLAEALRTGGMTDKFLHELLEIAGDREMDAAGKAAYLKALINRSNAKLVTTHRSALDQCYEASIATHPGDSAIAFASGIYYYNTERQDRALELFSEVKDNYPKSYDARLKYLQLLSACSRLDTLSKECRKAFIDFKNTDFIDFANYSDYQRSNYAGIIENSALVLATMPKDSAACLHAWSAAGDTYHEMGEVSLAFKAYDKALKINPDYAPVLNNYAYYLSLLGKKMGKAAQMSRKTVMQEPDNATYLDTYGWILHLQGRDLEAKPFFKHAMLYGGREQAVILDHYATVLEILGETELAKIYRGQARTKEKE